MSRSEEDLAEEVVVVHTHVSSTRLRQIELGVHDTTKATATEPIPDRANLARLMGSGPEDADL
jgi:hypothetical protein